MYRSSTSGGSGNVVVIIRCRPTTDVIIPTSRPVSSCTTHCSHVRPPAHNKFARTPFLLPASRPLLQTNTIKCFAKHACPLHSSRASRPADDASPRCDCASSCTDNFSVSLSNHSRSAFAEEDKECPVHDDSRISTSIQPSPASRSLTARTRHSRENPRLYLHHALPRAHPLLPTRPSKS